MQVCSHQSFTSPPPMQTLKVPPCGQGRGVGGDLTYR